MNFINNKNNLSILLALFISVIIFYQPVHSQKEHDSVNGNHKIDINIKWGESFNHPTFAIWIENVQGELIETLYVTEALAKGVWPYGIEKSGQWTDEPGNKPRPATLPYWLHKRNQNSTEPRIPTPEEPVADAITGATPKQDYRYSSSLASQIPDTFRIMLEINQPWDWNQYWSSDKYTDDTDYRISCQPAVVYSVRIDRTNKIDEYYLNPIGHSHYSGDNGNLYTDLTTLSTALDIIKKAKVEIKR